MKSTTSAIQQTVARRAVKAGPSRPVRLYREILKVDEIDDVERNLLGFELFSIFSLSYNDLDLATVRDEIIFKTGGHLAVFRNEEQDIVGFVTHKIAPIEADGKPHAVVEAGAYFRPGFGGGKETLRFGLTYSLLYKLRNPSIPLSYVCESLTPIPYSLMAKHLTIWPHRNEPTPALYEKTLTAVLEDRGFQLDSARPFVVRYEDPARLRRVERLKNSDRFLNDPDARFYVENNPNFAEGDIFCSIVPLSVRHIVSGFASMLVSKLRKKALKG